MHGSARPVSYSGMDYVKFDDCVAILQAPGTKSIMRAAVAVDGVGVEMAFKIAKEFDGDSERYREASAEALQRVNGVGENRVRVLQNDDAHIRT